MAINLSPRWVNVLEQAGFTATHWSNLGAILAATRGQKPSVMQVRATDVSPDSIGHQDVAAQRQKSTELAQGALLTVDANRTRLRLLPFAL